MQYTFFSLLTNKKERRLRNIRANLDKELIIIGAPWFSPLQAKSLNAKADSPTK